MACKKDGTCVSVPNLKLLGPVKTELREKKLGNFLLGYTGKSADGYSTHQRAAVWRFSKLWTAVTLAFIGIST